MDRNSRNIDSDESVTVPAIFNVFSIRLRIHADSKLNLRTQITIITKTLFAVLFML